MAEKKAKAAEPAAEAPPPVGCRCLDAEKKQEIITALGNRIAALDVAACKAGCKGSEKEAEMRDEQARLGSVKKWLEKIKDCPKGE